MGSPFITYSPAVLENVPTVGRLHSRKSRPGVMHGAPATPGQRREPKPADDFTNKLRKYVPAPTLAFFIPMSAIVDANGERWLTVVLAVVITALWALNEGPIPWWTPVLAIVSVVAWILGTTDYGPYLTALTETSSKVLFAFLVIAVPLADSALSRRAS